MIEEPRNGYWPPHQMNCVSSSHLDLDLPAEAGSVSTARHAVAEFIAGRSADRTAVEVAVSEAVSNAVLHAYRDGDAPGRVVVRARFEEEVLRVEVTDHGRGMRPRADSPGLGLGLPLIAQLASQVDIRSENGTSVVMEFAAG